MSENDTHGGPSRRAMLRAAIAMSATGFGGIVTANHDESAPPPEVGPISPVPEAVDGFTVSPFAAMDYPTQLEFGPGDDDPDLFATTAGGTVKQIELTWTPAGPVPQGVNVLVAGLTTPSGLTFYDGTDSTALDDVVLLVANVTSADDTGRPTSEILLVEDLEGGPSNADDLTAVVEGLPAGRHNANHLDVGPDGRVFIANGNATDHGEGDADVYPYSGAFLTIDPDTVADAPAMLHYADSNGDEIPSYEVADHEVNQDFAEKVDVHAWGFRNIFSFAFDDNGVLHTATNGSSDQTANYASQDLFYIVDETGPDAVYGFPWCFEEGDSGETDQNEIVSYRNPYFTEEGTANQEGEGHDEPYFEKSPERETFDYRDCSNYPRANGILGWHNCATGVDFPEPDGQFAFPDRVQGDCFVGECWHHDYRSWLRRMLTEQLTTRNTSHKITRVELDAAGDPVGFRDFVTGLTVSTDNAFGPEGAMYIADLEGIYRVIPTPLAETTPEVNYHP